MTAQSAPINEREPLRRSRFSAAILSLIVPGFGQFYAGRRDRGFVFVALYVLSSFWVWLCLAGILPRLWILAAAIAALLCVYLSALIDAVTAAGKIEAYVPRGFNRWYFYAAIAIALLLGKTALSHAADPLLGGPGFYRVPSASMAPTVRPGEAFMADVLYFRRHAPRRGDVVVFNRPRQPGARSIMRVVALGGDRVSVVRGRAVVNGTSSNEPYADLGDPAAFTNTTGEWVVPQGAVFVLGDNRANSVDSRLYGPVLIGSLIGRVTEIALSEHFDRVGQWIGTPPDHAQ